MKLTNGQNIAISFLLANPGWHSFRDIDRARVPIASVIALVNRGLAEVRYMPWDDFYQRKQWMASEKMKQFFSGSNTATDEVDIIYPSDENDQDSQIVGKITLDKLTGLHEVQIKGGFSVVAFRVENGVLLDAYATKITGA